MRNKEHKLKHIQQNSKAINEGETTQITMNTTALQEYS